MSELHEWINSAGVIAAIALSAFFGWQNNQLKKEGLLVTSSSTDLCVVKAGAAVSTLCWSVIIANDSEDRVSIIQANWKRLLPSAVAILGFDFLLPDGKPVSFPINLDGGEGKQIIAHASILLTSNVADINRSIEENANQPLSLREVQFKIAAAGLDVLGNKVDPVKDGSRTIGWRWETPFRSEIDLLTFKTGRGGSFSGTMTYPPPTVN